MLLAGSCNHLGEQTFWSGLSFHEIKNRRGARAVELSVNYGAMRPIQVSFRNHHDWGLNKRFVTAQKWSMVSRLTGILHILNEN